MSLHYTTPVPNDFFTLLPTLSVAELRVLLLIIRQTYGWVCPNSKGRKQKDKMNYSFIIKKTGLYRSCLSSTIQSLITKEIIKVTDFSGQLLDTPQKRKGIRFMYYEYLNQQPVSITSTTYLNTQTGPIRILEHNKRNTYQKKLIQNKASFQELGEGILADIRLRMNKNIEQDKGEKRI